MLMEPEPKTEIDRAAIKRELIALLEDREVRRVLTRMFEHAKPAEETPRENKSVFI